MRRFALFTSISALVLALLPLGPAQAVSESATGAIPGSYIVVLHDGEPGAVAAEHSRRHNSSVTHVYRHALRGYAARMSAQAAANVARDRRVAYVEQDGVATTADTQTGATWGLDRIDQRDRALSGTYTYASTGAGVTAYVLDSGIRATHADFGGRVRHGRDTVDGDDVSDDCNGHGTHVAGTIGGGTWGVAKQVQLVAVRVLNCSGSGSWSGVIAGIDWVTADAAGGSAVANMSLTGGGSTSVDDAVKRSIAAGVTYVLAAGNGNQGGKEQDACGYSPARVPAAITIGATTKTDAKTSWSNYGSCVDWFAPGAGITSAWYTSDLATNTISGTSMAAPHVAGTAALYLQESPGAAPAAVRDALFARTTKGTVTSSKTENNHLAYSGTDTHPPASTNTAPTASFIASCTDLTCDFDAAASQDTDGTVTAYAWNFGDGTSGSGVTTSRTYANGGTYTVTLTVTDDGGATGSTSQDVSVSASSDGGGGGGEDPAGLTLTASGYKVKGTQHADLSWSGTTSTVDIYRDGSVIATTTSAGDVAYTDNINRKGGGSYTYKVCEAGTQTCSNDAVVSF